MIGQAARGPIRLIVATGITLLFSVGLLAPVTAQDAASGEVTVQLNEVDGSGVSGSATLTPNGEQTDVNMTLEGPGLVGNHPTHIHTGTCSNFDPNPLFPLETVVLQSVDQTGRSVSTVDVSLDELQSGDYVVLVHLSREQITTYLACGEIPRANGDSTAATSETGGTATPTPPAATMPISGVGVPMDGENGTVIILGLGLLSASLLGGAIVTRRRQMR